MRYLISHPDAAAELGDLDVALYDGSQSLPERLDDVECYAMPYGIIDPPRARRLLVDQARRYVTGDPLANVVVGPGKLAG
ncbi:hypothetical protein [Plantactinospora sp. GCM10030261]|uniref:hypothetical protein n=1 Tax=Plantactinospora sp. GCM10030261 TaxID=3273420 RepID=UPI003608E798